MNEGNGVGDALAERTATIVAAFVSNNNVAVGDIANLINQVHQTLAGLNGSGPALPAEKPVPAVPIRRSITPDYLICLNDGKRMKTLKRHLMSSYGMTPEEYRKMWGLSSDYPMVAPNYAKQRSEMAKHIGLGTKGRRNGAAPEPAAPAPKPQPKRRGPGRPRSEQPAA